MNIKDIIKNQRSKLGLTMKEVAEKVGVSEGTISRWESGEIANMRRDKIMLLADALELSPAVIMGWDAPDLAPDFSSYTLTSVEESLVCSFRKLNDTGRQKALEYVSDLMENEKYTEDAAIQDAG